VNRAIRRVALALGLIFAALFVNLNVVQLAKSRELTQDPRNRRNILETYGTKRGDIIAAGNVVIARSVPSGEKQFPFIREYPQKNLFGHITGYYSFTYGSTGLERSFDQTLLGKDPPSETSFTDELFGRKRDGYILQLSVSDKIQRVAAKALSGVRGAAAVINSETGAVLALYANPTFDPNPISAAPSNKTAIDEAWQKLDRDPRKLLTFRATQERYPPGSTFKIITAAAGLENKMTASTRFPSPRVLDLPDTDRTLANYGGGNCGGGSITMANAFRISCNTTFAQIAMRVGPEKLGAMAAKFGLDTTPEFDLPMAFSCLRAVPGAACDDPGGLSRPATAYSGIGQQDVRTTPLQMAIVAATVGNGGYRVRPYVVEKVLTPDGRVLRQAEPVRSERIFSSKTAGALKQMMIDVVQRGTGSGIGFKNRAVGGKTGTAQTGVANRDAPHVWFVAFAPGIAAAAVVENGGNLGDVATGGKVAGPIVRQLIEAVLAERAARKS
jgi:penicillin-binding protein A